jgi:ketosteroid isomerase-like protein
MENDIALIKAVLNQYANSVSNGDIDSWISLWADDGTAMPPDAPAMVGKAQILEGTQPDFDQIKMELTIISIEDAKVYGDLGLTRCVYTLKATPKAGGETIDLMSPGKALTLYERQSDGNWKITYDCYNSSVPVD